MSNSTSTRKGRVVMDPDGDLVLLVGGETQSPEQEALVCSRAMRRASPVWKKMLYGSFKEIKPAQGPWIVSLPDDEPEPILAILRAIHGEFGKVPRSPSIELIFQILLLTNKYDTTASIRPWAANWMAKAHKKYQSFVPTARRRDYTDGAWEVVSEAAVDDMLMILYISWELGRPKVFRDVAIQLAMVASVTDEGGLIFVRKSHWNRFRLSGHLMPQVSCPEA